MQSVLAHGHPFGRLAGAVGRLHPSSQQTSRCPQMNVKKALRLFLTSCLEVISAAGDGTCMAESAWKQLSSTWRGSYTPNLLTTRSQSPPFES
eukprot:4734021-Amphidinium_carterae.1